MFCAEHEDVEVIFVQCQNNSANDQDNKCKPCDGRDAACDAGSFPYLIVCFQVQHSGGRDHCADEAEDSTNDVDIGRDFHSGDVL